MKDYETIFIINPTLSVNQTEAMVKKFTDILKGGRAKIVNLEKWGVKKLAYPINKKSTGFYVLVEFSATTELIRSFETELRREESIMRFLTVSLDKHALEYNRRRREGAFNKKDKKSKAKEEAKA